MNCPVCENVLTEINVGDIEIDFCKKGCGGIWFDISELRKVDEPHETMDEHLLEMDGDHRVDVDHTKQRNCPKCKDAVMMQHFFTIKHEVEVDECPKCGGYWLDQGEIAMIRSLYDSEEERRQAAHEFFDKAMEPELEIMRKESREQLEKAEKIANMFKYICPSYYIPGKQPWGAF